MVLGVDVPQFNDVAGEAGHRGTVLARDGVVVGVENINGQGGRQGGLGFQRKDTVAVGVVFPTQGGRCHAANGHAGALGQQISEAEIVDVPSGHVVIDVHGGSGRVVQHKADLDVLVDVVREVHSDVGPTRRVLSGGRGTRKAPLPVAAVLQATAVARDFAVPVVSKSAALGVVGAVDEARTGELVDGNVVEAAVVGREAWIRRRADLEVTAVGKPLAVGLGSGGRFEVVPGIEVGGLALEERIDKQLSAGHGDDERQVGRRCVAVIVVVGVVGVSKVCPPAFSTGGATCRDVGGRKGAVLPPDATGRHGGRVRRIPEAGRRALKVGQESLGNKGNRCGLRAVFVLEEGFV